MPEGNLSWVLCCSDNFLLSEGDFPSVWLEQYRDKKIAIDYASKDQLKQTLFREEEIESCRSGTGT